jgi:hypothetical protein
VRAMWPRRSALVPTRPPRICSVPSCPNFQPCDKHKRERKKDPAQEKHYNSGRWQKIRAIVRANQPICMKCKRKPSEQVHHLNNQWDDNRLENLEAWCNACHTEHSAREHGKKAHG